MKLLYIGNHKNLIQKIKEYPNFDAEFFDNMLLAYKILNSKEVKDYDAIIEEVSLYNANSSENAMLSHIGGSTPIPYILVNGNFSSTDAERLLKQGIADGYGTDISAEQLEKRIQFLKENRGISTSSIVAIPEYKIPTAKRLFDVTTAGIMLLITLPILLIAAIAIRLESKGKFWYASERVGTGYRVFTFYKFRSMHTGSDNKIKELKHLNLYNSNSENEDNECQICKRLGHPCSPILLVDGGEICEDLYQKKRHQRNASAFIKIKDDPRITKVGRFIRNTSIDELPQLINVLKGDMSIVGNRPLPLYEAELLTSDQWSLRFMAPTGITGLWQTKKRGKPNLSEEERKSLDNEYALTCSFLNDIKIILLTIPALLQQENV